MVNILSNSELNEQLLITETGHVSLVESSNLRPGCLGTLRGPAADLVDPTRNNRLYSRQLWMKVFNTPWVQEAIATKTLFGEVDHPNDRVESRIQEAALVLTKYEFNDATNTLDAEFDILDTPKGRILQSLATYGCKIGISSRGRGNVVRRGNVQVVDEKSFVFGGFDAVVLPAVKKARQEFVESTEPTSVVNALVQQIKECCSSNDLSVIKNILSTSNLLTESNELVNVIEEKESELAVAPPDNTIIIEGLTKDLEDAYRQIATLESKVNTNTADTISESEEYLVCMETMNSLVEEQLKVNDTLTTMTLALGERDLLVKSLKMQLESANARVAKAIVESKSTGVGESELAKYESLVSELTNEVNTLKATNENLITEYDTIVDDYNKLVSEIEVLESTNVELNSKLTESSNEVARLAGVLTESTQSYVKARCTQLGLDAGLVSSSLSENCTISDADVVIARKLDEKVRLSKLAISSATQSTSGTPCMSNTNNLSEELQATKALLKSMTPVRGKSK